MRKVYRGDAIEVAFDLDRCIHVGECISASQGASTLSGDPWIDPDAADPSMVARVVERCPSGALQSRRLDGRPDETHPATSVTPMRNGPLRVTGHIGILLDDGTAEVLPRATLCHCGGSARKPFCDNTHLTSASEVRELMDDPES